MNTLKSFLAMSVAVGAIGCGGFPIELEKTVPFKARSATAKCGTQKQVIDFSNDPTFQEHHKKIRKVELVSADMNVLNPRASPESVATSLDGTISFVADEAGTLTQLATFAVPLDAPGTKDMDVDRAAAGKISDVILTAPHKLTIEVQGCADQVPASVDSELKLKLRIVIDPI